MAKTCAHLIIHGTVQGVFYRASAQNEARDLGLVGWVRNLPGGEVEAEVEGEAAAVDQFIDWCRSGPPGAQVTSVAVTRKPYAGQFQRFSILR
jgi:acylphosphatase